MMGGTMMGDSMTGFVIGLIAGFALLVVAGWFLSPPGADKGPHW